MKRNDNIPIDEDGDYVFSDDEPARVVKKVKDIEPKERVATWDMPDGVVLSMTSKKTPEKIIDEVTKELHEAFSDKNKERFEFLETLLKIAAEFLGHNINSMSEIPGYADKQYRDEISDLFNNRKLDFRPILYYAKEKSKDIGDFMSMVKKLLKSDKMPSIKVELSDDEFGQGKLF